LTISSLTDSRLTSNKLAMESRASEERLLKQAQGKDDTIAELTTGEQNKPKGVAGYKETLSLPSTIRRTATIKRPVRMMTHAEKDEAYARQMRTNRSPAWYTPNGQFFSRPSAELAAALRRAKAAEEKLEAAAPIPDLRAIVAEGVAEYMKQQRLADRAEQATARDTVHTARPGDKRVLAEAGTSSRASPPVASTLKATPEARMTKSERKRTAKGKEPDTNVVEYYTGEDRWCPWGNSILKKTLRHYYKSWSSGTDEEHQAHHAKVRQDLEDLHYFWVNVRKDAWTSWIPT
jgi:hypothetical protein